METTIRSLRCVIAEILLTEKAATKETWENHILGFLTGAIREFYKARLGEKNKLSVQQDIEHWYKEVRNLIQGALGVYDQPTKKKFNKPNVYREACKELKAIDAKKRRQATRIILDDYGLATLDLPLTDKDTEDFWKLADATILDE